MVLYRQHPGQASRRRRELQLEFGRRIGLREIDAHGARALIRRCRACVACRERMARAGRLCGARRRLPFPGSWRRSRSATAATEARQAAAWALVRSSAADASERVALARAALRLDPMLPMIGIERLLRRRSARVERAAATFWLRASRDERVRLAMVLPEPTPYRTGMLDLLAQRPDLDLTVIYAQLSVQRRTGTSRSATEPSFVDGWRVPGASASAAARLPALARASSARCAIRDPRSWSSPAGARSLRRQRSPGAGDTASPTCSSSSRTSATPGPAGGGR